MSLFPSVHINCHNHVTVSAYSAITQWLWYNNSHPLAFYKYHKYPKVTSYECLVGSNYEEDLPRHFTYFTGPGSMVAKSPDLLLVSKGRVMDDSSVRPLTSVPVPQGPGITTGCPRTYPRRPAWQLKGPDDKGQIGVLLWERRSWAADRAEANDGAITKAGDWRSGGRNGWYGVGSSAECSELGRCMSRFKD